MEAPRTTQLQHHSTKTTTTTITSTSDHHHNSQHTVLACTRQGNHRKVHLEPQVVDKESHGAKCVSSQSIKVQEFFLVMVLL
ncbi:hypothetical protein E2C01_020524 [Portunus trituberculatus]|uniref:Uncharacterized protein n=1 Tax=Portunus trituberculatus TaxID=210409 RepID=A0A5B7E1Q6_PORTR|nr:hypothetical protein [Portunus trituberculatus]